MNTFGKSSIAVATTLVGAALIAWGTWAIHSLNNAFVETPAQIKLLQEKNKALEERLSAAWGFSASVKSLADTNAANIRTSNELRQFMHLMTALALFSGNTDADIEDVKDVIRLLKNNNSLNVAVAEDVEAAPEPERAPEPEHAILIEPETDFPSAPASDEPKRLRGEELEDFIEDQVQMQQQIRMPSMKK